MEPQTKTSGRNSEPCPECGRACQDWERFCTACGQALRPVETAARAEIGHIAYLLHQTREGGVRQLSPAQVCQQIVRAYEDRLRILHAEIGLATPAPVLSPSSVAPMVPPLPEALTYPRETAKGRGRRSTPDPTANATPPPDNGEASWLRAFVQEHALKVLFALATILVLAALRSMMQWEWMDEAAIRLIPCVPLGLTAMFWQFGNRTREENRWASYIYHSLAVVLLFFDTLAAHKFWLGSGLSLKPLLLLSVSCSALGAGVCWRRWREAPYLHLTLGGVATALYLGLQLFRPDAPQNDFSPTPLWLFGTAYLGMTFALFLASWQAQCVSAAPQMEENAEALAPHYRLWAHLCTGVAALIAFIGNLSPNPAWGDWATMALVAGVLYGVCGQLLGNAPMVYASGAALSAGALMGLEANHALTWEASSVLLFGMSALALALAAFNRKQEQVATAWGNVARSGVLLTTALVWGGTTLQLLSPTALPACLALSLTCAAFHLYFAGRDRQEAHLYGVWISLAFTLWGGLRWSDASIYVGALATVLYGAALCLLAYLQASRRHRDGIGAEGSLPTAACGQFLATLGMVGQAVVLPMQSPFAFALWMVLGLGGAGAYLGVAKRFRSNALAFGSLCALVGVGVGYLSLRYLNVRVVASDYVLPDLLCLLGCAAFAAGYRRAARWSQEAIFSYSAAILFVLAYVRAVSLFSVAGAQWSAFGYLPCGLALWFWGRREAERETDALLGMPLRAVAHVGAAVALILAALAGDGVAPYFNPGLVSASLLAYAGVYAALLLRQPSPSVVAVSAGLATLGCLHHLLTLTEAFRHHPPLGWTRFAFYSVQIAAVWVGVAWTLTRRSRKDLAQPLLNLAGVVAICSAAVALVAVQQSEAGGWGVLTLLWAGAVWFGLWRMEQGEPCLHVGFGNLLVAWTLVIYDALGGSVTLLDIHLLPLGLYLLILGHRASRDREGVKAHRFWCMGLLFLMTPAFFAYLQGAEPWHTVLFLLECLGAVLWGIAQRIRAYVCLGLGFAGLYGASHAAGYFSEFWGTLTALALGVGLFALGFYALTRRERLTEWANALDARWQSWLHWR